MAQPKHDAAKETVAKETVVKEPVAKEPVAKEAAKEMVAKGAKVPAKSRGDGSYSRYGHGRPGGETP